jgi:pyruvate,orthophosphate dikinase
LALAAETRDPRFAWDCYARFAESYAQIVRGIPAEHIEDRLFDIELSSDSRELRARTIVDHMQDLMINEGGSPIPIDPCRQVIETIEAVFQSWNSDRARAYRRFRGIDDGLGTAAVIQVMVFGNRGPSSGSGVAFTRNPSTGEVGAYGDFLFDAQGEEVVDGSRDPVPLTELASRLPETHAELETTLAMIERDARDMCEVEFTVEDGRLWVLQTRVGQRSGQAAVRAAVEMVDEGLISEAEAIQRVSPAQAEAAAAPVFLDDASTSDVILRGTGASPGAAVGTIVFDVADAVEAARSGTSVILLRPTTSPSDVAGFIAAVGIITGRGGRTSHAAVVARGMGRPAVCGVGDVAIAPDQKRATVDGVALERGCVVSLDGTAGVVAIGQLEWVSGPEAPLLQRLLEWCKSRLEVPIDPRPASPPSVPSADVLVLDDPEDIPVETANRVLAEANARKICPTILVSQRWARAASRNLTGEVRLVGCLDPVVSLPLLARAGRAADVTGPPAR